MVMFLSAYVDSATMDCFTKCCSLLIKKNSSTSTWVKIFSCVVGYMPMPTRWRRCYEID